MGPARIHVNRQSCDWEEAEEVVSAEGLLTRPGERRSRTAESHVVVKGYGNSAHCEK